MWERIEMINDVATIKKALKQYTADQQVKCIAKVCSFEGVKLLGTIETYGDLGIKAVIENNDGEIMKVYLNPDDTPKTILKKVRKKLKKAEKCNNKDARCIEYKKCNGQKKRLKSGYDAVTIDLPANENVIVTSGFPEKIGTGYKFKLPAGYDAVVQHRSGVNAKGLNILGYIDNDYRGEVSLTIHNSNRSPIVVEKGDYIAQLRLVKREEFTLAETDFSENDTQRGGNGFGSTG